VNSPSPALAIATIIGAGIVSCLGTRMLIPVLRRAAVLDRPNERSSHQIPTPRGGGLAVIGAALAAWLVLVAAGLAPASLLAVITGAAALAGISWLDDIRGLRGLSPAIRLGAQCAAVALGVLLAMPGGAVFQGWLPAPLDRAATALLWVWFVNLYNFMDGIDGIAGSGTASIGIGLALFAVIGVGGVGHAPALAAAVLPGAIAAAAIGFLVWNWAPARIFLGDVGSVPLGYLLGFLLLATAAQGHWKIALILPLYFLADATLTLLRRLLRGERVWRPHREHFYQQAVRRGLGHAAVVRRVIAANAVLIGCAWAAEIVSGALGLATAAAAVLVLLASLAGVGSRAYTAPHRSNGGQSNGGQPNGGQR
jgi:UDP-N-acetylmuramyl pentapeptide phosphotransferase/UDP-N-acetylglucosamine-1-phosphate transferase